MTEDGREKGHEEKEKFYYDSRLELQKDKERRKIYLRRYELYERIEAAQRIYDIMDEDIEDTPCGSSASKIISFQQRETFARLRQARSLFRKPLTSREELRWMLMNSGTFGHKRIASLAQL